MAIYFLPILEDGIGSEQRGHRPVILIQNDVGNQYSPTIVVAPITSKQYLKTKLPTHCYRKAGKTLKVSSVVLLEQLRTIDKKRIGRLIGK